MAHRTATQLARGRPRGFDTEVAVERAMTVFWSRGYHGTALPDLLSATRLSRGSLYAAFGGKHALFLRALDRYIADALARIDVELGPRHPPVDGLRAFLAGYLGAGAPSPKVSHGRMTDKFYGMAKADWRGPT